MIAVIRRHVEGSARIFGVPSTLCLTESVCQTYDHWSAYPGLIVPATAKAILGTSGGALVRPPIGHHHHLMHNLLHGLLGGAAAASASHKHVHDTLQAQASWYSAYICCSTMQTKSTLSSLSTDRHCACWQVIVIIFMVSLC